MLLELFLLSCVFGSVQPLLLAGQAPLNDSQILQLLVNEKQARVDLENDVHSLETTIIDLQARLDELAETGPCG